MRMGTDSPRVKVAAIPTGAINLDAATGVGGIPRGRITEIYGPESSGKTTLTLHLAANVQKAGGVAAYVDAEHALDIEYAKKLGVNVEDLLVSQPDTGEQALEIVEILVRSGAVDLVVIDSVAALVPKAEIEGEMGDSHMGLQARLMSQALRKLAGAINRSNCAVVFINQLREKIGVMFGNPETTTGGKALKFYASLRLDIRRIGPVKERETVIGNHVRVKVVKNKVAPPFRQAEFDVMFDEGISHTSLLVDLASEANIIQKSGAWYSYGDQRIGQGRENAKLFLRDNPAAHGRGRGQGEGAARHARRRGRRRRRAEETTSDVAGSSPRSSPTPAVRARFGSRSTATRFGAVPAELAGAAGLGGGRAVDAELQRAAGRRGRRRGRLPDPASGARAPLVRPARLGRRLLRKGHPRAAVEAALERAVGLGLLDDAAFAAHLRADPHRPRAAVRRAHARSHGHGRRAERSSTARIAAEWPEGSDRSRRAAGAGRQARPPSWRPAPAGQAPAAAGLSGAARVLGRRHHRSGRSCGRQAGCSALTRGHGP